MLLNILKLLVVGKPKAATKTPKYESWYNSDIRLWTAQFKNDSGDQIGSAGFGANKSSAIEDLFYQNIDILE
jgi:hypothetical protein